MCAGLSPKLEAGSSGGTLNMAPQGAGTGKGPAAPRLYLATAPPLMSVNSVLVQKVGWTGSAARLLELRLDRDTARGALDGCCPPKACNHWVAQCGGQMREPGASNGKGAGDFSPPSGTPLLWNKMLLLEVQEQD